MKVLVTGGTGFVGSHTVAAVRAAGHEVRLFVRDLSRAERALSPFGLTPDDYEQRLGDVNDVDTVRSALDGCDAVIHSGSAYAYGLPFWKSRDFKKTNVIGTANVLRTAHEMGLDPIVHVSSSMAIMRDGPVTLTEDSLLGNAPTPYPRSKIESDRLARQMQSEGAPVVITYPAMVWGPHDPHWGETARVVASALKGMARFGPDGTVPVSDVREIAALHAAVLAPARGPRRYLAPAQNVRWSELIRLVGAAAGRDLRMRRLPSKPVLAGLLPLRAAQAISPFSLPFPYAGAWFISVNNTYARSRAESEFGIRPRPVEETVRDTVEWAAKTGRIKSKRFRNGLAG